MAVASVAIGCRCFCEGYYGTVKFIGPVPPNSGEWMGVEWDDTSRGRHDGTKDGVRYFHCSKSGNCASFVRLKKLDLGLTYKQALEKRYGEQHEEADITIGDSSTSTGKKVEMYGFDKQAELLRQYSSLNSVDLTESSLSSAGTPGEVAAITPHVAILDLSKNPLLASWNEVADITRQLPQLNKLLLSDNRLLVPSCVDSLRTAFKGVTILYMNKMCVGWAELVRVLPVLPCLKELHVCENNISTLRTDGGVAASDLFPASLKLLNLEENQLCDWRDILQLARLPNLESLILNLNQLSSIQGLTEDSFPSLKILSINGNRISEWSEIDDLNKLRTLNHLRFIKNPVHENEHPFFCRQLTIARLSLIKVLNNSEVTKNERQESERYYIKKYVKEWLAAKDAQATENFLTLHPLYQHHVEVHGLPPEVIENQQSSRPNAAALKNRLIAVTVLCPDRPELATLNKKLPDSMTVQKLKGLLQRVYKIHSSDQILSYKSHKMSDSKSEIEMNDDLKQLSYYSLESDDHIIVRTLT